MSKGWWTQHPFLGGLVALLFGLVNGYEAVYVHRNSPLLIVDGALAVVGFIAFFGLFFRALSAYIYKSEE